MDALSMYYRRWMREMRPYTSCWGKRGSCRGNINKLSLIWRKPSDKIASIPIIMTGSAGPTDDWLRSFLSALGYAKKTVRAFERAVELGPSNLEALSDVFEYYLQAPGMVGGGLDKAEDIAKRFAGLNAAEYHWARARLAEKRKDFETAEREFRAAFATAPNELGRALDLATFLSSRGRYSESDTLFRAAEDNYPRSPKVLYARAAAYIQSKRKLGQAEALLDRYLELQTTPEDPSRREAAALLKSARELRPKFRQAE